MPRIDITHASPEASLAAWILANGHGGAARNALDHFDSATMRDVLRTSLDLNEAVELDARDYGYTIRLFPSEMRSLDTLISDDDIQQLQMTVEVAPIGDADHPVRFTDTVGEAPRLLITALRYCASEAALKAPEAEAPAAPSVPTVTCALHGGDFSGHSIEVPADRLEFIVTKRGYVAGPDGMILAETRQVYRRMPDDLHFHLMDAAPDA